MRCDWLCFGLVRMLLHVSNTSRAGLCYSDLRTAGKAACAANDVWSMTRYIHCQYESRFLQLGRDQGTTTPAPPWSLWYPDPTKQALHDYNKRGLSIWVLPNCLLWSSERHTVPFCGLYIQGFHKGHRYSNVVGMHTLCGCCYKIRGCYRYRPPSGLSTRQVPRWSLDCIR